MATGQRRQVVRQALGEAAARLGPCAAGQQRMASVGRSR
jgi:hypothetical protein